jgi:hypothetical protein
MSRRTPRALIPRANLAKATAGLAALDRAVDALVAVLNEEGPTRWRNGYRAAWSDALVRLLVLRGRLAADIDQRVHDEVRP